MRDVLGSILPTIHPSLIGRPYSETVLDAASRFPAELTRWIGMECRLDPMDGQVDFGFIVSRSDRNAYLQGDPALDRPPFSWDHPVWSRLREFFAAWGQSGSILDRHVLSTVFEFDLPRQVSTILLPGFFFGTSSLTAAAQAAGEHRWATDQAVPQLLGEPLSPGVQAAFERCLACLPAGAHLYQVGLFFSRPGAPLRVCIDGIPPAGILQYLRAAGYPADLAGLEAVLAGLTGLCEIGIDLDLAEQVQPKLCLECSLPQAGFFDEPVRYAQLLDTLVKKGWCSPEKRLAVLAYPGIIDFAESSSNLSPEERISSIDKEIMLIKLVYQPGRPLRAKAYLQALRSSLTPVERVKKQLAYSAREQITRSLTSQSATGIPGSPGQE